MAKTAGIVSTASARDLRPESAVRGLIDNTITRLKKHQEKAEVEAYESLAKSACSDFRIIVEKTIEYILLADVVGRFRRAINTQGKLHKVATQLTRAALKRFLQTCRQDLPKIGAMVLDFTMSTGS